MRRLLFREFERAGVFSGDCRDAKFYRSFVAIRAVWIQPVAAGEQSRKPRGNGEQRPDFVRRRGHRNRTRKLQAAPRAASMARTMARRGKTRAISPRYSSEARKSA